MKNTYLALAGPSGIRTGWCIEIKSSFEVERPPPSAGPPSGGRAATLTPSPPLVYHWTLPSSLSYKQV